MATTENMARRKKTCFFQDGCVMGKSQELKMHMVRRNRPVTKCAAVASRDVAFQYAVRRAPKSKCSHMPLCVLTAVKRLHSRGSRHDTLAASSQPSVVYLGGHQMLLQTSASLVVTGSTQYALRRAPRYFGLCQTNSTPIGHASFH